MVFSDEIQPILIATLRSKPRENARGHSIGGAPVCGRTQIHIYLETRRKLFPTVLRSRIEKVNLSMSSENVFFCTSGKAFPSASWYISTCRSVLTWPETQTKSVQVSTDKSVVQLDRSSSLPYNKDQLAVLFNESHQCLHEVEQALNTLNAEKEALVFTAGLQATEIRTLKAEKEIRSNLRVENQVQRGTDRKRQKGAQVYSGLSLPYVEMTSDLLKYYPACYAHETAEPCFSESVEKRLWSRRDENVFCNSDSSGEKIALFPSDSVIHFGKYYCLLLLS